MHTDETLKDPEDETSLKLPDTWILSLSIFLPSRSLIRMLSQGEKSKWAEQHVANISHQKNVSILRGFSLSHTHRVKEKIQIKNTLIHTDTQVQTYL